MRKGKKWHDHAKKHDNDEFHTPTTQRLIDWSKKHKADPDSAEAIADLKARQFDVNHPPE